MINNFRNFSGKIISNLGGVGVGWWRREFDNETTSSMRHFTPRFLLLRLFSSLYNGVKPERHGSSDIVGSQTTFICKFRERHCNGLRKTKRAGTKEMIRLPLLYPSYNNTCTLLYLLLFYLLLMFSAVIFMFYSVWWQFL